ncbi:MAG: response regulator [Acidimicrobiales bacterium]
MPPLELNGHLAAIVESSDDAILSLTLDGVILSWNAAAERLYGYTAEEILGTSMSSLVPPDNPTEVGNILARVRRGKGIDRHESVRLRKNGTLVPVWLTISPVRDGAGNVVAVSTIARDITERKRIEAALAQARDQAMVASRVKSEFLATISHEIRTPLNGVIGLTGLLLETELTERQRHHAEGVRASGEALLAIINDILDFAEMDAGELELEAVDFDLSQVLEEVAALVAESARAKDVELMVGCNPELPIALRGDVGRVRQVLYSFATNAIKFTEAGEVALLAGLAEEPTSEGVVVRFEVVDTGIGVDPLAAESLFEPFSQVDSSSTRRYAGIGLSLAICRRLAEGMSGTIGVESRPGLGSTFWLRLPLGYASGLTSAPDPALPSLERRRVLVVDDNRTTRLMLASQLRAWRIAADVAADAEDALGRLRAAAAEGASFEVALLDSDMPGMGGLDLARVVGGDPALGSLHLLLLTSGRVDADAVARAGFVAHLPKPVRFSSLRDALVRAVTPSASPRPSTPPSRAVAAGSTGMLLIVEDHAISQEVAKALVVKLGYASDVAANGIEALEALDRRSYDAVLMDCHMPEMDGFRATEEIRRREAGQRHVPIIAMTAGAPAEGREKCIAAGMDDYLSKPLKAHLLEAMLDRLVGGAPVTVAAAQAGDGAGPVEGDGVLDAGQLETLRGLADSTGDPAFLRDLIDDYLETAASQLAELRAALGDPTTMRRVAHSLKGASATLGAIEVASACAALEVSAAAGRFTGPDELQRIAVAVDRAAEALHAVQPSASAGAG